MTTRARAEGWDLTTVVDSGTTHPYYMVISTNGAFPSDRAAGEHVVNMARQGGSFHRHALHTVMQSRVVSTTKKG